MKCVSYFMLKHLMMSWHLNVWKVKIWLLQERQELLMWNKRHTSLFHKFFLLDVKNRLAKMQQTQPLNQSFYFLYTWGYAVVGFISSKVAGSMSRTMSVYGGRAPSWVFPNYFAYFIICYVNGCFFEELPSVPGS